MVAKNNKSKTSINEATEAQSQFVKILFCADSLEFSDKTQKVWLKGRMKSESGIPRKVINVWGLTPKLCREILDLCEEDPFLMVEVIGFFDAKKITLRSGGGGNTLYSLNNSKVLRDAEKKIKTQTLEIEDVPVFAPRELTKEELSSYSRKTTIEVNDIAIDEDTMSKSIEEEAETEAAEEAKAKAAA